VTPEARTGTFRYIPGTVKVWLTWVFGLRPRTARTCSGMFGIMCCTWIVPPTVPQAARTSQALSGRVVEVGDPDPHRRTE
jgi:hypothetical protein